ncbi:MULTISPECIES: hypothetical protein [unclassified Halomonas]|uniref:hypothetical protein n=1 Tax=unclassified Halomonas TaxID=2609666 RepID=UPI003F9188AE
MRVQLSSIMGVCFTIALGGMSASALAESAGERLSGDEIRELVWGNQVQGAMAGGQDYSEIYLPEGEIVGDGYSGQATIVDDTMCFDYGDDEINCYGVSRDSDGRIEWISDDEVVGYGNISDAP